MRNLETVRAELRRARELACGDASKAIHALKTRRARLVNAKREHEQIAKQKQGEIVALNAILNPERRRKAIEALEHEEREILENRAAEYRDSVLTAATRQYMKTVGFTDLNLFREWLQTRPPREQIQIAEIIADTASAPQVQQKASRQAKYENRAKWLARKYTPAALMEMAREACQKRGYTIVMTTILRANLVATICFRLSESEDAQIMSCADFLASLHQEMKRNEQSALITAEQKLLQENRAKRADMQRAGIPLDLIDAQCPAYRTRDEIAEESRQKRAAIREKNKEKRAMIARLRKEREAALAKGIVNRILGEDNGI